VAAAVAFMQVQFKGVGNIGEHFKFARVNAIIVAVRRAKKIVLSFAIRPRKADKNGVMPIPPAMKMQPAPGVKLGKEFSVRAKDGCFVAYGELIEFVGKIADALGGKAQFILIRRGSERKRMRFGGKVF